MVLLTFLSTVAILLYHFPLAMAWRSFKVVFDNVTVTTNPDWAHFDIEIKEFNGDSTIDLYLNILKAINNPKIRGYLRLNSILDPDTDKEESVEIFNKTMNLCQILSSKKIDPLIRVILTEMTKNGTMFNSCPIQKKLYYLQNFRIDEEHLPSYLPEADFLVEIHVLSDPKSGRSINYFNIILNGRIDKSKALDDFKIFTMG